MGVGIGVDVGAGLIMGIGVDVDVGVSMVAGVGEGIVLNNATYQRTAENCQYYDPPTAKFVTNVCRIGAYTGVL